MPKLFGTDGVRGLANQELTPELALRLAQAHAVFLRESGIARPHILVGRDTRISSPMLEAAYVAGLNSQGADATTLGILPTPGVAFLTSRGNFDGGIMISASHNPIGDNGIKIFGPDGFKLNDQASATVERHYFAQGGERPTGTAIGTHHFKPELCKGYVDHLVSCVPVRLEGLKVVLDCANGAGYAIGLEVFQTLGAELYPLHAENDGSRINVACGSTDLSAVKAEVKQRGAHFGVALDGDADRCLAVDENAQEVDGDRMLYLFSHSLREQGRLRNQAVVATVMSNFGLERAFHKDGTTFHRTQVGDRYVLERMLETGAALGGEQSGHLIFIDHATTGDGLLSALLLAARIKQSGQSLSKLTEGFQSLPQLLVNIHAPNREKLKNNAEIDQAIEAQVGRLGDRGRILVRPSGTEPLVRVMAEGPDEAELREILDYLAELIKVKLA